MELVRELLSQAIIGESFAEQRYEEFFRQALAENLAGIATLFKGLAMAEAVHILNHKRALEKINAPSPRPEQQPATAQAGTLDNLAQAIAGEAEEINTMYPSFIKQINKRHAKEFTAKVAILSLRWAMEAEKVHLQLLKATRKGLAAGHDLDAGSLYLCGVCGNLVHAHSHPEQICPVCGHDPHFYNRITI